MAFFMFVKVGGVSDKAGFQVLLKDFEREEALSVAEHSLT